MARLPRLTVTDWPHLVVLRGNNGAATFVDDPDRQLFLALMAELGAKEDVAIHAYSLQDNEVHLLVTPRKDGGLALWMQGIGRAYVRRFNHRHGRSGTLWEGRYRCTVIQPDKYLLTCMVFIDGLGVHRPGAHAPLMHAWSSHGHYIGVRHDKWLTVPPQVWSLGNTPFEREAGYRALVERGLSAADQSAVADAALHGWALGDDAFLAGLAAQTDRRLVKRSPGRPRKSAAKPNSLGF